MKSILKIQDLSIAFTDGNKINQVVNQLNIEIPSGSTLGLVGESGSGKTVTAYSILQLLPKHQVKYEGHISFYTKEKTYQNTLKLKASELLKIRGGKIGVVFQEPMSSLNPLFTIGSQINETIISHTSLSKKAASNRSIRWLEKVNLPNPSVIFNKYPHQLSGGQQQRVMIAMAMSCSPSLLICDEPTTALDVTTQQSILELIKKVQKENNMTILFITHDISVVEMIADDIVVLQNGKRVEKGKTTEILKNPKEEYTKNLLACRPHLYNSNERLPTNNKRNKCKILTNTSEVSTKEKIIEIKDLFVHYKLRSEKFTAIENIRLDLEKGETLGIVGESGSGKTTLVRAILGLIPNAEGRIMYKGKNLLKNSKKEWKELKKNFQLVFQDPYSSLQPRMTIGAAIAEPLQVHKIISSRKKRREKVFELMEKVGLDAEFYYRYPHEFSGGQRQRIVLARALALEPLFLFCDEPVSALDVTVQAQILNLLNDLKREFNFTMIFISHDLSVIKYMSDRIIVMKQGKITEFDTADNIFYNPKDRYTKQLLSATHLPLNLAQ